MTATPPIRPPPDRPPATFAALAALGIVYGDLGTSPLYTLQTVVQATGGRLDATSGMGVLSLIVWTLILTISVKYCLFVMRADNHGEGGILALMSLVGANRLKGAWVMAAMGLIGAALIYGDGIITPAISVLSALEGLNVATNAFKPWIMPMAVAILAVLFFAQRLGTARIGVLFGPIMLAWFIIIAVLGLMGVIRHPQVLLAINPIYAVSFLAHGGPTGFLILGGVFLCITGGEAMYADMGHLGAGPIRLSWYAVVLPALLLNYAGQVGLLMAGKSGNAFFQLAPAWAVYPLVALAAAATIIASQAIITGAFSMTRQAVQLGWLPPIRIRQTSDEVYGQIYVPLVNWLMMIATIGVTLAFGSSDRLAGAYGTAVSTTMLLTTGLLYAAMRRVWRWPLAAALPIAGLFLIVDLGFFSANLLKIVDGGWLPLTFGLIVFAIMIDWRAGVEAMRQAFALDEKPAAELVAAINAGRILRPPGAAVFLTRARQTLPRLLVEHVRTMGALHQQAVIVTVDFAETPRVADEMRTKIEVVAAGVWRVALVFGFIEIPDVRAALCLVTGITPPIDYDAAVYFSAHDTVAARRGGTVFRRWRLALFTFLLRNAARTVDNFNLPAQNVVEVGRMVEL